MGESRYVLGVKISRNHSKKLLSLSQGAHINKILEHFEMHYSKSVDIPVGKDFTFSLDQCPKIYKEKGENEQCLQCKCNSKLNVCHVMYTA